MSYTDAEYLAWDPFSGADRDVKIRARTVKIATTRKPQKCMGHDGAESMHDIPAGTRVRFEQAIVDGEWGRYYICLGCMATWLRSLHIHPADSGRKA